LVPKMLKEKINQKRVDIKQQLFSRYDHEKGIFFLILLLLKM